ncbi:phosphoribosylglycinamide formyltransferase [Brevibacillus laterosporus]|uniref:Phosphoribosylglycinamide formyltransferase n=1 Tax=Brevibacillus laterosporus LMG 15441 TaxID=1042163 RepID=A0A075R082_BRELA|nr:MULTISPECIES: phosphoribosylglycinamide formyltransferase [Brevibacillus]HAS00870.1 phosphoribosylglycinamide formyltransferase [Brevibacillus sp.]AIG24846.1 phosphoribosylglycinamide formyltransferase [Brevibacillus laterosporus LMG 15441]MBA4533354.1 phosphoribosylglycinamide formyltransferase [Brevibacillus halotolerans]MCR8963884.1 phosphoribosylglycinamide formyltransferase [Brevibacillus laterosporus]MCZ0836039.1 phosphoribosylglycinamide formyltransferase [Brevibacillus halotolerans]
MRIAVFASGSGSNFEAIVQATRDGRLPFVEVALLVCDQAQAYAIKRAERLGIPVFLFSAKDYVSKEAFEQEILVQLKQEEIDFIVLAGYMRLIGNVLLTSYQGRMINLHPSLLPAFPGKDAIKKAWEYGVKVMGATVHFVDEGMDTGPIIDQEVIFVHKEDTEESLQQKIHEVEHRLLIRVLQGLSEEAQLGIEGKGNLN